MNLALHEAVMNFEPPPRKVALIDRLTYLRVPKPDWLRLNPKDGMSIHFQHLSRTFRHGVVIWGRVVQADMLMFSDGEHNHPGEVVYSLEDPAGTCAEALQDVAGELFSLKGTRPDDPRLETIADYLTNEYTRVFGLRVPEILSGRLKCRVSTTMLVRKHLAARRLCQMTFPLLVNPQAPFVATPLPTRYWRPEFIEWWMQ